MSLYEGLQILLIVGLLVLIAFVVFVMVQLHRTLSSFSVFLDNVNRDLPPLLSKLQQTLDGVNSEIDRVEHIVASFHEVSTTVQTTTDMVQKAVASPFIRVSSLASGAGAALSRLIKRDEGKKAVR